jgi:hypothetical protein
MNGRIDNVKLEDTKLSNEIIAKQKNIAILQKNVDR